MNDTPHIDDPLPPRRDGFAAEGETFGHYQVMRREDGSLWELGRGAMGVTYKAFDTNLRCPVALKVISADYIHSDMAGQRFVREARVAARLRHPNVASVYHLGVDPQAYFYSMEFIDGETLEDLVARVGPLPLETVLHVGLQVARALAAAARQGLIHRDIKPANVMVLHETEEGEDRLAVKVIDFGLARTYAAEDSSPQLTATGFVGTPLFSSPEQLEEQDLDVRSDIYSLGVTLWILLVGRPPFEGKMTQVITQHLHAPPPWWQLPACPEPVRVLLEKMLQKNRLQRYQSAGELRQAIERCLRAVTNREDLWRAAEGSDPGESAPASAPAALSAPAPGTAKPPSVVARSLARVASNRRLRSPWVIAPSLAAVLLAGVLLFFWRSTADTGDAVGSAAPRNKPVAAPVPPAAEAPPGPSPAVAAATPSPAVVPAPEATPPVPEPTPTVTPPPLLMETAAAPRPSGLDDNPAVSPAVVAADAPSPAASDAHEEADASPEPTAKSSVKGTRSHRTARPAPTPTPNFFQKLFGIKPKPTPKKK